MGNASKIRLAILLTIVKSVTFSDSSDTSSTATTMTIDTITEITVSAAAVNLTVSSITFTGAYLPASAGGGALTFFTNDQSGSSSTTTVSVQIDTSLPPGADNLNLQGGGQTATTTRTGSFDESINLTTTPQDLFTTTAASGNIGVTGRNVFFIWSPTPDQGVGSLTRTVTYTIVADNA